MLADDPRIRVAAFVAETFGMDPIEVLRADYPTWRIRFAAAQALEKAKNPEMDDQTKG